MTNWGVLAHSRHMRIRVASHQYWLRPVSSFAEFKNQVSAVVRTAADYRCALLVLPEYYSLQLLTTTSHKLSIRERVRAVAGLADEVKEMFSALGRETGMYVVGGSMPVIEGNGLYNEALLSTPTGTLYTQKKIHMTRFEAEGWGMIGGDALAIFDTEIGKLAITTCYDVEFPELIRPAALAGAQIFAVPSCTDDQAGYYRVRYCGQARAIENQVYVIQAPTVGGLPDVVDCAINYGQAAIMAPCDVPFARGGIICEGTANIETTVIGELDMQLLVETRTNGTVRTLRDAQNSPQVGIHTVAEVR